MQARIVGAARGARWLGEGWRLFRAAPLGWLALTFAYWLAMSLLSLVPLIGVAGAALLVPAFSVGFMAAGRAAARGGRLELTLLFDGFRHGLRPQLALGSVYLLGLAIVLASSSLADGGALARWMLGGTRPDEEALHSDDFLGALALAAALYAPLMMAFWFAPPLAAWHSVGAAKALFFSFFGCLMNWRAFLAYGTVGALVLFVGPFLMLSLITQLTGPLAAMPLVFPLLIVVLPTLFASFYVSYRDVFGGGE